MPYVVDRDIIATGNKPWLVAPDAGQGGAVRVLDLSDGGGLARSDIDRTVFVREGDLRLQIGETIEAVSAPAFVRIPADTPHRLFSDKPETVSAIEIFAPSGPDTVTTDSQVGAGNMGSLVRACDLSARSDTYTLQVLCDRQSDGVELRAQFLTVQAGTGMPDFHIHAFDQCYYLTEGVMEVEIGCHRQTVRAGDFVFLPAGVVHRNWNPGPAREAHLSLLMPPPAPGAIFDFAVDIHDREAEIMTRPPDR